MRTQADLVNALAGCVRVGADEMTVGVPEKVVADIVAQLGRAHRMEKAAKAMKDFYEEHYGAWSDIEQAVIDAVS